MREKKRSATRAQGKSLKNDNVYFYLIMIYYFLSTENSLQKGYMKYKHGKINWIVMNDDCFTQNIAAKSSTKPRFFLGPNEILASCKWHLCHRCVFRTQQLTDSSEKFECWAQIEMMDSSLWFTEVRLIVRFNKFQINLIKQSICPMGTQSIWLSFDLLLHFTTIFSTLTL